MLRVSSFFPGALSDRARGDACPPLRNRACLVIQWHSGFVLRLVSGGGACKYPHPAVTLVGIWARPPVSPGTPLPPPRVAVPGEHRRAGSVSWGAISLFVPPLCPALQRVAQEVPSRLPAPQNSPGRSDPPLPSLGLSLQSLPSALPHPVSLTQEADKSRPSTCPLVGLLATPCPTPGPSTFRVP